ncbi:flavodoxin family protein [Ruminococcaceae bacterium OttesenSCG-928-D13]|nr:flavodoxin family protein [Ruminococcaceae bacterium OttesenSCG-928-D13]
MMKVLGLSFGRKNSNCDIVVKEALLGAQAAGAEVRFVNTMNLKIGRCIDCGGCTRDRQKGGNGGCILPDDYPFIENEIFDADAIILAAPVYVLGPTGQYKNVCDRIGPARDRAFMTLENKRREELGMKPLDERIFKDRFVGLISVGGARTENWTSFGLSGMHLFTFSMQMTVVDQINLYGSGDRVNPAFDPELMARLGQMGKNVASCVGMPRLEAPYFGDDEGICPLCHCDLLTVKGTTNVECPVCGTHGTLQIDGDKVSVHYSDAQIARARCRIGGVEEHVNEINSMVSINIEKMKQDGDKLPGLLEHQKSIVEVQKYTL